MTYPRRNNIHLLITAISTIATAFPILVRAQNIVADDSILRSRAAIGASPARNSRLNDLPTPASVVGRFIFYNQSFWDGNNADANASDDGAIAPDKQPLLPGGTATFSNYTSFSRGINGIIVDIQNPTGTPMASDFEFRAGNDNAPDSWAAAPAPTITVRVGAGVNGSDRVTLLWPNGAIQNQWLRVRVLATISTGLALPDVFYIGNAIGEVGNSPLNAIVNAADRLLVRNNSGLAGAAPITSHFDINRDGAVNAADQLITRNNANVASTALQLISVPPLVPPTPEATLNALADFLQAGNIEQALAYFSESPRHRRLLTSLTPSVRVRMAEAFKEATLVSSNGNVRKYAIAWTDDAGGPVTFPLIMSQTDLGRWYIMGW